MLMEEKLIRALQSTGLEVYALERPEGTKSCIVYNYSETNQLYSDDDSDLTKYMIYVNLYCQSGLSKYRKQIKESMKSESFGLNYIAPAYKSKELGIQQAFTFVYYG